MSPSLASAGWAVSPSAAPAARARLEGAGSTWSGVGNQWGTLFSGAQAHRQDLQAQAGGAANSPLQTAAPQRSDI